MKLKSIATITAALALSTSPAFAQAPAGTPDQNSNPGTGYQQQYRPASTPTAEDNPGSARKLAAPGRYCKAEPKKKAAGQTRSDFSTCVQAQAKLRNGKAHSPRDACKDADKRHVKGEKGTAFSRCVSTGAKLLRDQKAQNRQDEQAPAAA